MVLLKTVLNHYTEREQKQVVKYMRSNGRYKPYNVIERLQVDLYQASIKQRSERQNKEIQQLKTVRLHGKCISPIFICKKWCNNG